MDMNVHPQIERCAPEISAGLMTALVQRESNGNPFAIGLDGKEGFFPQPRSLHEAVSAAEALTKHGKTFSVGLAQIHSSNIKSLGITWRQAFDGCENLRVGQQIFSSFHSKAIKAGFRNADAVFAALRGYNSGNLYAPVSNVYATAIMANATSDLRRRLSPSGAVRYIGHVTSPTAEPVQSESAELFEK
ncbi:lytic transglycosylase domain-containing protein [Massilia sp. R2A-15]|uniref:lytic transglycosylase domain-containing protein n=1 Tax=Massilia sp. R2A-15 TaxID=3064278 RepID=UPI002736D4B0|nr:lytic transglycosylase domain-containing protein [Massilia sp. R2A-15]WLI87828.1 lytic transglycosylase domain-containing protein [Massilia sp. R2A-15]